MYEITHVDICNLENCVIHLIPVSKFCKDYERKSHVNLHYMHALVNQACLRVLETSLNWLSKFWKSNWVTKTNVT